MWSVGEGLKGSGDDDDYGQRSGKGGGKTENEDCFKGGVGERRLSISGTHHGLGQGGKSREGAEEVNQTANKG